MNVLKRYVKILTFKEAEQEFFIKAVEIKGHKVKLVSLGKGLSSKVRVYLDDKKFGDFAGEKKAMSQAKKEIG